MNKVLVILGPTTTGKTDLALGLAKKLDGELIVCDSRQVYQGLDIGTGKMPGDAISSQPSAFSKKQNHWVIDGVKIWGYDLVDFNHQFNVKEYVSFAQSKIKQLTGRGVLPIIVGGSGLYLKALLEGFDNLNTGVDQKLRDKLEKLTVGKLQKKMATLSPNEFNNLNQSERYNKRRLIRKIELLSLYPYDKTAKIQGLNSEYRILKIGLTAPRPILTQRIDSRIVTRVNLGMINETVLLHQNKGLSFARMRELGLEYACLADLLEGKYEKQKFVETLQTKSHQYAKRQMTWFKKEQDVHWFDISQVNWRTKVEILALDWYNIRG